MENKKFIFILASITAILFFMPAATAVNAGSQKIKIVTTTTLLYDLALNLAPDDGSVEIDYIMGPGTDPHLYQASAGDVSLLQQADIILYNGLNLEGKMSDVFTALENRNKLIICAGDGIHSQLLLADEGNPNMADPHIWFDISLWKLAAVHTGEKLIKILPNHQEEIKMNMERYLEDLTALEAYTEIKISELEENQRVLITAHDAFAYFGRAYKFEVKGLQGINTETEAGTYDMSNLAQFIAENKINALFSESSVPPKSIEALQAAVRAKGFDVAIGGELYSDSLGDEKEGTETYIKTFKYNIDTIVSGLKGENY